jgi:hypothetical protein
MTLVQVLPRLWVGTNRYAGDRSFFIKNNIRHVVNFNYDVPNYFKHITYYNVPLSSDQIREKDIEYNMQQLFGMVNDFIIEGYRKGVGIYLHDKSGNLSALFAAAFMIEQLKLTFNDVIRYYSIHNYSGIDYIRNNSYLDAFAKQFNYSSIN